MLWTVTSEGDNSDGTSLHPGDSSYLAWNEYSCECIIYYVRNEKCVKNKKVYKKKSLMFTLKIFFH